ncbi:hypothetical protein Pmi06nite_25160 [Planotetraspora mira]|uniref:Uncharacterized protein n=1 Tax=Planotetraspora mira TaxID=58121 RepID=A0A8J3X6Q8_9ACTN|nr:hypothetical protein Pmi06nite_25160 [Planotetraspora mira]
MDFNGLHGDIRRAAHQALGFARKGDPAPTGIAPTRKTSVTSRSGPVPSPGDTDCSVEGAGDS